MRTATDSLFLLLPMLAATGCAPKSEDDCADVWLLSSTELAECNVQQRDPRGDSGTDDDTGSDTDDDTGSGPDTGADPTECNARVESTTPIGGASNAYYRSDIEFDLSHADPTAVIETDIPGTLVVLDDGERIVWRLSEPLAPNTSYTATLNFCGGAAPLTFTTSDLGTPLQRGVNLVGQTYAVDLSTARVVEPAGIGAVLASYLTQRLLVQVTNVSGATIDMRGAVAVDGSNPPSQDPCVPTFAFTRGDFSESPFFSAGPADMMLGVAGLDVPMGESRLEGTFALDGSYIGGGQLSAIMDTRSLAPLLGDGNPGAFCDLAVNFGETCEACPSDGQPYCLPFLMDQMIWEQVDASVRASTGNCAQ